ncbi:flagellar hook capping FlgD N-terminal domain-containing protein [Neomoorella mulderi]|uniref:Basal-body rod modification protein FlgD n=1 Tax=Moorella mulderi DSM 14980 TaxID=1122241 RepID=A0A151AYN3_9FIRM|nr:flagellar hook capping FlgD N-terminal domain-containing protein [Moorella mulderi]KYH32663.1 basal-body rod modification protein FlgD [Moorella mulderi DSM 14980]
MNASSVTATGSGTTATVTPKSLGKDDFLKLLAAQLRSQDPLNPMSNTEFIAQMAQFSALEQMNNLNESFNLVRQELQETMMLQAVSLIGKEVTAVVDDQTLMGTVSKVSWTAEGVMLLVGGQQVPLQAIAEVAMPATPAQTEPAS